MTRGAAAAALSAALACAVACRSGMPRADTDAPIVLISIDTLRADRLSAYGYAGGSTPALDRLARE